MGILLSIGLVPAALALGFLPLQKPQPHQQSLKEAPANEEPDFSGKYKGTCYFDENHAEPYHDLTFTIYSTQHELQFDDYNDFRFTYRIGAVSGHFTGQNDSMKNDSFSYTAVHWNADKTELIMHSTFTEKPADVEGPMFTGIEKVSFSKQGDTLLVNAEMRRFDDLDEGYVKGTLACTFTKMGETGPLSPTMVKKPLH